VYAPRRMRSPLDPVTRVRRRLTSSVFVHVHVTLAKEWTSQRIRRLGRGMLTFNAVNISLLKDVLLCDLLFSGTCYVTMFCSIHYTAMPYQCCTLHAPTTTRHTHITVIHMLCTRGIFIVFVLFCFYRCLLKLIIYFIVVDQCLLFCQM